MEKCLVCGLELSGKNSTLMKNFCDVCATKHAKSLFF